MLQRDKSIILSVSVFFRMVFPIHSDQSFLKHLYSVSPSVSKSLSTLIWKTFFETLFNSIAHRMTNRSFLQLIYCPYEINCIWYNTPTIFQIYHNLGIDCSYIFTQKSIYQKNNFSLMVIQIRMHGLTTEG